MKVTPAPGDEGSESSSPERPRVVRKRKAMSAPAGAPLKKPTLRLQKTTDLDVHEAHVSAGATTVVTSMPPPPLPSPTPNMPIGNEEERIKEPEHFQVANVTDDALSHDTEAHVDDEPMDDTMVADDLMEAHNNIIDPNNNQGFTEGGWVHVQSTPHFEYASSSSAGGGGDPDLTKSSPMKPS
ncbi:hypothetical protein Hdeb2414_s0006g00190871 [Helianthus debilis subsp. tardiflorus]